jgi:hypothetical protein
MWITNVYFKSNKTARESRSNKTILLFTAPLVYYSSFCSYRLLAPPLKLVTMQSHPHTLEIADSFLVMEMFMEFRKLGFLQYPFYFNNFYLHIYF